MTRWNVCRLYRLDGSTAWVVSWGDDERASHDTQAEAFADAYSRAILDSIHASRSERRTAPRKA